MYRRIIVAIISSVVFSTIIEMLVRDLNAFFLMLSIALPSYLLGGIPFSFLIERYFKNRFVRGLFYLISGFIVGVVTSIIFSSGGPLYQTFVFGRYGIFASLIYFIVSEFTLKNKN